LGLLAGAVMFGTRLLGATHLLAAALGIAALAPLTRGLHLDGLADLVDGLSSYRDPEGTRAVMRAPDTGPLGVAALVLVLLVQTAALTSAIDQHRGTVSLVLAVVTGRVAILAACTRTPAATAEGLGALVAATVRPAVARSWVVAAVVAGAVLALDPDAAQAPLTRALIGAAAVTAALLVARLLRAHATRRTGGLTGDVLGALTEVATTVALVVLALGS
ncbi:MAG: adenosylcobinamide-GDP ribazoletransferase, partial [Actinomycetota bacterium]|nr:adenosylcobinamide-GDP ribazoletransferase [Actinomycetota bacterium]